MINDNGQPKITANILQVLNEVHKEYAAKYDYQDQRRAEIFKAMTQAVQYVYNNDVEGDIAEFGTFGGFSAGAIASAMYYYSNLFKGFVKNTNQPDRTLYLFDSFAGLPEALHEIDQASPNVQTGRWQSGTFTGLTEEELTIICKTLYPGPVKTVAGYYETSLHTIAPSQKFALLHLDCDLYSSTSEVLDYLFAHNCINEGAMLCFDDWNCNRSSPQLGQRKAWAEAVAKYQIEYSDNGTYAVLSHMFIVHSYKSA